MSGGYLLQLSIQSTVISCMRSSQLQFCVASPYPARTEPVPMLHYPPKESLLPNFITSKHPKMKILASLYLLPSMKRTWLHHLCSCLQLSPGTCYSSPQFPPVRLRIPNSINFSRQVPCLMFHTIWQPADVSQSLNSFFEEKTQNWKKTSSTTRAEQEKRLFVSTNWLYFYSSRP